MAHSTLKKFLTKKMQNDPILFHFKNIEATLRELSPGKTNDAIRAKALAFTQAYHAFYALNNMPPSQDFSEEYLQRLETLEKSLDAFVTVLSGSTFLQGFTLPLQAISSFVLGTIMGLMGAVMVGIQGFIRGALENKNPFAVGYESFLAGGVVSAIAGKRLPEQLFNDAQRARLMASVGRLEYIHNRLKTYVQGNQDFHAQVNARQQQSGTDSIIPGIIYNDTELRAHVKEQLMRECYPHMKDTDAAFARFLGQYHAIQVCTLKAKFGMQHIAGDIGHHSFIRVAIEERDVIPIAYGVPHEHPEKFVDQAENIRIVSGKQLFEIYVAHERLKTIHTFDTAYLTKQYKAGEYDCRSYVNQLLDFAGLPRTKIRRFVPELDNVVGATLFKPMLTQTSFFNQNMCTRNTPDLKISLFTRAEYKQYETAEEERLGRPLHREEQFNLKLKYTGFDYETRQRKIQEHISAQSSAPQQAGLVM